MTQNAIVTKLLPDGYALVSVQRESACGGNCASCGGCASPQVLTVRAKNGACAAIGDRVVIESRSSQILRAAALVYLLPLVLLFLGYFLASALHVTESLCILSALAGLVLGLGLVVAIGRSIKRRSVEIISVF